MYTCTQNRENEGDTVRKHAKEISQCDSDPDH